MQYIHEEYTQQTMSYTNTIHYLIIYYLELSFDTKSRFDSLRDLFDFCACQHVRHDNCSEDRSQHPNHFEPPHGHAEEAKLSLHIALDWSTYHAGNLATNHAKGVNGRIANVNSVGSGPKRKKRKCSSHILEGSAATKAAFTVIRCEA